MVQTDSSSIDRGAAARRSPAVILAAACMASAGLIHAAAAGAHNTDETLATMFAVTAVAQLGWAALVMARPTRATLAAGAVLAFGAVGFWAVTKVWGIGFVSGLAGEQPADFQDTVASLLEVGAGVAAVRALWHPARSGRRSIMVTRLAVVFGALALVAAVPAAAAPHDGDHGGDGHHGGSIVLEGYSFEADITTDQQLAAQELIDETKATLDETPYWDYDAALADGYVSIGDQVTGYEHLVHVSYIANENILDPNEIESLVYSVAPNGVRSLVSAMYLMPFGTTMDDVPDIAGDVTVWHDHQNLCWNEDNPVQVVGILNEDGECDVGVFRPTQPMLHVWVIDHRCGPFAGIEGSHGESCSHEH